MKVTAVWEQGSNADIALDEIAIGAACFTSGKLSLMTRHISHTVRLTPRLFKARTNEISLKSSHQFVLLHVSSFL